MFFLTESLIHDRMAELRREADAARLLAAARVDTPRRVRALRLPYRRPVVAVPGVGGCRPRPVA